jgi:DNA segregation ATPase FtsK/SpoIIIE, S-DNA-T family
MLFEISTSLMAASLIGYSKLKAGGRTSDHEKIKAIACGAGLADETFRILRRTRIKDGMEYAYQLPQGRAFKDFAGKIDNFQDGLNVKRKVPDIKFADVKAIDLKKPLIPQIKEIAKKKKKLRKEVEIEYDGALVFRVYNEPLTDKVPYDPSKVSGWSVPVGQSRRQYHTHDFDRIAHMIVAGGTDKGKSVFLKNVITTLVLNKKDDVTFTLIDLKGGLEFSRFRNLKQTVNFAKNADEALEALEGVLKRLETTMGYLLEHGFENVKEAGFSGRHFVIVDEAAEISSSGETDPAVKKAKMKCEAIITDIARRGRAAGFRLVYATQYPTNETLKSQVRQNIGARVCFRLETSAASLAVLDETGAEELPLIPGRAIYRTDTKTILQAPYIENGYIREAIEPHIVIRARQDEGKDGDVDVKNDTQRTAPRKRTLNVEETDVFE